MNKKLLILSFISLVLVSSCLADWTDSRAIIQKITLKEGYGKNNIRYAYYEDYKEDNKDFITYAYINCRDKNCLITFYKPSFNLSSHDLNCVTLHELGHYKEYKMIFRNEKVNLSESYANDFMQNKDDTCLVRYSE